jgi:hypothetical protein
VGDGSIGAGAAARSVPMVDGMAGDRHPGHGCVAGQPPAGLRGPGVRPSPGPHRPPPPLRGGRGGCRGRRSPAAGGGPHPPWAADLPPGPGGPTRTRRPRSAGHHHGYRQPRLGGPAVPGPPGRSCPPRPPTTRRLRPSRPRSGPATTRGGRGGARGRRRHRRGRRPPADIPPPGAAGGGSRRRAASSRTGSASTATCWGTWRVPWASTRAWAGEISPPTNASAVLVKGPRNSARAVRTSPWAAPAPIRCRLRSQLAVDGVG